MQVEVLGVSKVAMAVSGLVIVDQWGEVWLTGGWPWWAWLRWFWWWLTPGPRTRVTIRPQDAGGRRVQVPAVRLAPQVLRLGTPAVA